MSDPISFKALQRVRDISDSPLFGSNEQKTGSYAKVSRESIDALHGDRLSLDLFDLGGDGSPGGSPKGGPIASNNEALSATLRFTPPNPTVPASTRRGSADDFAIRINKVSDTAP